MNNQFEELTKSLRKSGIDRLSIHDGRRLDRQMGAIGQHHLGKQMKRGMKR